MSRPAVPARCPAPIRVVPRVDLARTVLIGRLGTVAFAMLIGVWIVAYCAVSPPAQAAYGDVLLTDERVAALLSLSPILVFAALLVGIVWWNRGVPATPADDGDGTDGDVTFAPATVPDVVDLQTLRRPDRG